MYHGRTAKVVACNCSQKCGSYYAGWMTEASGVDFWQGKGIFSTTECPASLLSSRCQGPFAGGKLSFVKTNLHIYVEQKLMRGSVV